MVINFKLKDIFVLLIKYMPIIQMVGMLFNNLLYYFNICNQLCYCIDFVIGNSIITTFLLFVCSYLFGFCNWHRLMIASNFINIMIANIDILFVIPISNLHLLALYFATYLFLLIIIMFKKFYKQWSY